MFYSIMDNSAINNDINKLVKNQLYEITLNTADIKTEGFFRNYLGDLVVFIKPYPPPIDELIPQIDLPIHSNKLIYNKNDITVIKIDDTADILKGGHLKSKRRKSKRRKSKRRKSKRRN